MCFWYSHALDGGSNCSTVVILRDAGLSYAGLFRLIETAADLLAKQLANIPADKGIERVILPQPPSPCGITWTAIPRTTAAGCVSRAC